MMKIKVIRMISPNAGVEKEANIVAEADGKSYISFTDLEGKHKLLLPDDVKPINLERGKLMKSKDTVYLMARDNFLNIEKHHFVVTGAMTRELAKQIAEWGAIAQLARLSREGEGVQMGTLLIIGALLAGLFLLWNTGALDSILGAAQGAAGAMAP